MTKRDRGRMTLLLGATIVALAVTSARADLSASYDGSLSMKKSGETAALAAALKQAASGVSGTMAMESSNASVAGVYSIIGQVRGAKASLTGANASGEQLRWKGRVKGDSIRGAARLKGPGGNLKGVLLLTKRSAAPPVNPPQSCDNDFFTGQVLGTVLQPVCAACHIDGGSAATANFRVTPTDPRATMDSVALNIDVAHPDDSRILQKPLNILPHGGGQQLSPGSPQYQTLQQWVNLVATGQQCDSQPQAAMVPLSKQDLLIRASMDLRGQRPTLQELDAIEADPNGYAGLVNRFLRSPEFLERVKDVYDDALLVRREDFQDESRDETAALYGEALELISYIVANDRPFTEIGTADYTMSNSLFQRDTNRMPYAMDPIMTGAWQPTHYRDGRPHAGLLSTSAFYEVWTTNDTNKNRRRANRWSIVFHCYNFLDTPVDVTRNVDNNDADAVLNAVTTRSDCKACHDRLDPLASFLFPMDNARLDEGGIDPQDFYNGDPERWRQANRRPPAVYGMPGLDIRDMGRLLVSNPKFAQCQTKRAFKMLFLRDPQTTAELNTAGDIASRWASEDNYNFRSLVRRWMVSDVYTNHPATNDADWVRRASPERLELMIKDLTGFEWDRAPQDDEDDADPNSDPPRTRPVSRLTNEEDGFKIIVGGINGVSVSGRNSALNASVVNVHRKLAALAADYVVTNDLAQPGGSRKLLNGVTGTENPTTDEAALRTDIAGLSRRMYGHRPDLASSQVTGWLQLYRALYNDTTQSGNGNHQVPGSASERAWRGLLTAMLRSPKIILY